MEWAEVSVGRSYPTALGACFEKGKYPRLSKNQPNSKRPLYSCMNLYSLLLQISEMQKHQLYLFMVKFLYIGKVCVILRK